MVSHKNLSEINLLPNFDYSNNKICPSIIKKGNYFISYCYIDNHIDICIIDEKINTFIYNKRELNNILLNDLVSKYNLSLVGKLSLVETTPLYNKDTDSNNYKLQDKLKNLYKDITLLDSVTVDDIENIFKQELRIKKLERIIKDEIN